jgi:hypothetical protein
MIVSVHLPKTAGSSFLSILKNRFGERLLLDYGDFPVNTPRDSRQNNAVISDNTITQIDFSGYDCIHGHFLPRKYLSLAKKEQTLFVTWLRDPLERMVSHYTFWKRTYHPIHSPYLHRRMILEEWSLERFCLSDEMHNIYAQFLWCFSLSLFDFIGITEHFEDDIVCFSKRYLSGSLHSIPQLNVAPSAFSIDSLCNSFRSRFRYFHSEDYNLYNEAINSRIERVKCKNYL